MTTIRCGQVTFPSIRAIFFDKDGTLANSEAYLRNLGQRRSRLIDAQIPGVQDPLLMAFGLDGNKLNPAGLLAVGTRLENAIAAAAYVAETGRDWIDSLNLVHSMFEEADQYLGDKAEQTPIFDGVIALLQALADAGVNVGILSSDTTAQVQAFVHRYQLEPYLNLHLGIDGLPAKPDPTLVYAACDRLSISPNETLIIGDSQADIAMAQAAGTAGCIAVTWGWAIPPSLNNADASIHHPSALQIVT